MSELNTTNHRRDAAQMTWVYPVVSRRAAGVSVGINLNPNNACNFRCIYCQVPGLTRGMGPEVDLPVLEEELRSLLGDIVHGDFMTRRVPEGARVLKDVAFSGNGEPTSSPNFEAAMDLVLSVLGDYDLIGKIKVVLITNGTLGERPSVLRALSKMAQAGGEVWFKLDRGTADGIREVNDTAVPPAAHLRRLAHVAEACPTWIQTCMFARNGEPPSDSEVQAWLDAVGAAAASPHPPVGVLLYGLARKSYQPEAPELSPVSLAWLEALGERVRRLGLPCRVTA